jgi:hypothetical protein
VKIAINICYLFDVFCVSVTAKKTHNHQTSVSGLYRLDIEHSAVVGTNLLRISQAQLSLFLTEQLLQSEEVANAEYSLAKLPVFTEYSQAIFA